MGNTASGSENGDQVGAVLDELRELERKIESVQVLQKQQAQSIAEQLLESAGRKGEQRQERIAETVMFGSHLSHGKAKVVLGPVVGKVTEGSARILIETDIACDIILHVSILDDFCPGGREIMCLRKSTSARRPCVFNCSGLEKGTRYHYSFSGLVKGDILTRHGSFKTFQTGKDIKVGSICGFSPLCESKDFHREGGTVLCGLRQKLEEGNLDLLIHAGGQVDLRAAFRKCAIIMEQTDYSHDHSIAESLIFEELTEVYRLSWNVDSLRVLLANCSNLMIWSDLEMTSLPRRNTLLFSASNPCRKEKYPRRLIVLAMEVFRLYQRALWDEDMVSNNSKHGEYFAVSPTSDVGILFLDTISAQVQPDGSQTPWPQSPMLAFNQIRFIQSTLNEWSKCTKNVLLVCDRPVVPLNSSSVPLDFRFQEWSENESIRGTILDTLLSFLSLSKAHVTILCGTGPFSRPTITSLDFRELREDFEAKDSATNSIAQVIIPTVSPCYNFPNDMTLQSTLEGSIPLQVGQGMKRTLVYTHSPGDITPFSNPPLNAFAYGVISSNSAPNFDLLISETLEIFSKPQLLLGPVIGRVSFDSAWIMIQVDGLRTVTCQVSDVLSGRKFRQKRTVCSKEKPIFFHFDQVLEPDRFYKVDLVELMPSDLKDNTSAEFSPSFRTMPHGSVFTFSVFLLHGDSPVREYSYSPMTRGDDVDSPWTHLASSQQEADIQCSPNLTIHLGGQVDLELQTELLRSVVRMSSRGRHPSEMSFSEISVLNSNLERLVRRAYQLGWALSQRKRVLANGSNIFAIRTEDVQAPKCFKTEQDLVPYASFVESAAMKIACEYQWGLNGFPPDQRNPWYQIADTVGIILFSHEIGYESDRHSKGFPSSQSYAQVEQTLKSETGHLKTLLVVPEKPILDGSLFLATGVDKFKTVFEYNSSLRLIQTLLAWKQDHPEREIVVLCKSEGGSYQSTVQVSGDFETRFHQVCIGPISKAPNLASIPFPSSGEVDLPREDRDDIQPPKLIFSHESLTNSKNVFGLLHLGSFRKSSEIDSHKICVNIPSSTYERNDGTDTNFAFPLVSWLAEIENLHENLQRADGNAERRERRIAWEKFRKEELEIREAVDGMRFPEEEFLNGNDMLDDSETLIEAITNTVGENEPNRGISQLAVHREFRWVPVNWEKLAKEPRKRLEEWHNFQSQQERTLFLEYTEEIYQEFTSQSKGMDFKNVLSAVEKVFLSHPDSTTIGGMCLPRKLETHEQKDILLRQLAASVLSLRWEALQIKSTAKHPFAFSEFVSLCGEIGALSILAEQCLF